MTLANVSHSIYKAAFPDFDRWVFQQCSVAGPRYAVAVMVNAFVGLASELGRTVGIMLERGEVWYFGRRFTWFTGGGRDPIANRGFPTTIRAV